MFSGGFENNYYVPPDGEYLAETAENIIKIFEDFLRGNNADLCKYFGAKKIPDESKISDYYSFNYHDILQVVARVRKEVVDMKHLNEGMETSECKVAGLYAYWIFKIKPFFLLRESTGYKKEGKKEEFYFTPDFASRLNSEYACYFVYVTLSNMTSELNEQRAGKGEKYEFRLEDMNPSLHNELVYNLQFRNVSMEAMALMVEFMAGHLIPGYRKAWKK